MIGVYFLIKKGKVIYIGQTKNFNQRIKGHSNKKYDSYRFVACDVNVLLDYESRWIKKFKPKLNKKPGRTKLPSDEKMIPLTIYVKKSLVKENGGANECRKNLIHYAKAGFPIVLSSCE